MSKSPEKTSYLINVQDSISNTIDFQSQLVSSDNDVHLFKKQMENLVSTTKQVHNCSNNLYTALANLSLWINDYIKTANFTDNFSQETLKQLSTIIKDTAILFQRFNDQINASIITGLQQFITSEYTNLKSQKNKYEKTADSFSSVLKHYSGVSINSINLPSPNDEVGPYAKLDGHIHGASHNKHDKLDPKHIDDNLFMEYSLSLKSRLEFTASLNKFINNKNLTILDRIIYFTQSLNTLFKNGHCLAQTEEKFLRTAFTNISNEGEKENQRVSQERDLINSAIKNPKDNKICKQIHIKSPKNFDPTSTSPKRNLKIVEGYLFKRTSRAGIKTWQNRWIILEDGSLWVRKSSKGDDLHILCEDLSDFRVKEADEALDRRFTIEISSGKQRLYLQALNKELQQEWIKHIQNHICPPREISKDDFLDDKKHDRERDRDHVENHLPKKSALSNLASKLTPKLSIDPHSTNTEMPANNSNINNHNEVPSTPNTESTSLASSNLNPKDPMQSASSLALLDDIMKESKGHNIQDKNTNISPLFSLPGNAICADCGKSEPRWCSINLGIVLCIDCSGVHRSLGVHISKVRSLTLDALSSDVSDLMFKLGNDMVNKIYLSSRETKFHVIKNTSDRQSVIREKYVNKKWVKYENILRGSSHQYFGIYDNTNIQSSASASTSNTYQMDLPNFLKLNKRPHIGGSFSSSTKADPTTNNNNRKYSDEELQTMSIEQTLLDQTLFIGSLPQHPYLKKRDILNRRIYSFDKEVLTSKNLLYLGAKFNNPGLLLMAIAKNETNINMVVDDETGDTALHIACTERFGNLNAIKFLMLNNAKVDIINEKDGQTPLHRACNTADVGAICLLLEKKLASVAILDKDGHAGGDILKMYIQNNHSVLKSMQKDPSGSVLPNSPSKTVNDKVDLNENETTFPITGFLASEKLQIETVSLLKIRQSSELDHDISSSTGDTMRMDILKNYYYEREDYLRNPCPPGLKYTTILKRPGQETGENVDQDTTIHVLDPKDTPKDNTMNLSMTVELGSQNSKPDEATKPTLRLNENGLIEIAAKKQLSKEEARNLVCEPFEPPPTVPPRNLKSSGVLDLSMEENGEEQDQGQDDQGQDPEKEKEPNDSVHERNPSTPYLSANKTKKPDQVSYCSQKSSETFADCFQDNFTDLQVQLTDLNDNKQKSNTISTSKVQENEIPPPILKRKNVANNQNSVNNGIRPKSLNDDEWLDGGEVEKQKKDYLPRYKSVDPWCEK